MVGAAVPFVKFWSPSARARAAGAPVKIDFSKLQEGEMLSPIPAWRGKPIFLLYRTADAVSALEGSGLDLADAARWEPLLCAKPGRPPRHDAM